MDYELFFDVEEEKLKLRPMKKKKLINLWTDGDKDFLINPKETKERKLK